MSSATCNISGQPINDGDRVVMVILKKTLETFTSAFIHPHSMYSLFSFPVKGTYSDDHFIEKCDETIELKWTLKVHECKDIKELRQKVWGQNFYQDDRDSLLYPMYILEEVYDYLMKSELPRISRRRKTSLRIGRPLMKQLLKKEKKGEDIHSRMERKFNKEDVLGCYHDKFKEKQFKWDGYDSMWNSLHAIQSPMEHFGHHRFIDPFLYASWDMENPLEDKNYLEWLECFDKNYALNVGMDRIQKVFIPQVMDSGYKRYSLKRLQKWERFTRKLTRKRLKDYYDEYGEDE